MESATPTYSGTKSCDIRFVTDGGHNPTATSILKGGGGVPRKTINRTKLCNKNYSRFKFANTGMV